MLALKGEPGAARKTLEEACRIAPKNAEARFQLGVLSDNTKLNREAVEQFRISVALRPLDPRAYDYLDLQVYYLLATVYSHLGEHELARQYAELSKTAAVPIQDRARN